MLRRLSGRRHVISQTRRDAYAIYRAGIKSVVNKQSNSIDKLCCMKYILSFSKCTIIGLTIVRCAIS